MVATDGLDSRLRPSCTFGIGYGDDIDEATGILTDAATATDGVLADPGPSVRVVELADNAVLLQARVWIDDPDREEFSTTRSAYVRAVKERCEAAGIDLSTTTQHELSGELAVAAPDSAAA